MTNHRRTLLLAAPLALGLGVLAGCAATGPYPPPPAPIVETLPKPPVSAEPLRWRPGYWTWSGTGYTWTGGEYVPQSTAGTHWMPGHWVQSGGAYVWKPAGWAM